MITIHAKSAAREPRRSPISCMCFLAQDVPYSFMVLDILPRVSLSLICSGLNSINVASSMLRSCEDYQTGRGHAAHGCFRFVALDEIEWPVYHSKRHASRRSYIAAQAEQSVVAVDAVDATRWSQLTSVIHPRRGHGLAFQSRSSLSTALSSSRF